LKAFGEVEQKPMMLWVLLPLVLVSALGVIYSSYQSRQHFSALQQEHRKTIQLEEQWGRLLLEESTWAAHARIERLANTELNMSAPKVRNMAVVK
jgi:cell division protein FtsL